MEELWDSLCAQTIADDIDGSDIDARIAARERATFLESEYAKAQSGACTGQDHRTTQRGLRQDAGDPQGAGPAEGVNRQGPRPSVQPRTSLIFSMSSRCEAR